MYTMIKNMLQRLQEVLIFLFLTIFAKATGFRPCAKDSSSTEASASYCLSWRLAVESNNVRAWRTVPDPCFRHVETYMTGGQYERDMNLILEQILSYADGISLSDDGDGKDAWILDVDETCISNERYYKGKRYGCDPYDPDEFREWALKARCPAIPAVLGLFNSLLQRGFKVFLLTGREQETLGQATLDNLYYEGFIGYERLILRTAAYRGQGSVAYKSHIRKQLQAEGYRIWGNVGDQWGDIQGECSGNRTFKLPNPMYFVP